MLVHKAVHSPGDVVFRAEGTGFARSSGYLLVVPFAEIVRCAGGRLGVGKGDRAGVFVEGVGGVEGRLLLSEGGALTGRLRSRAG